MRPLKSHFPDHALTTLDTLLTQTKEAWVVRRAQAVREVVVGHHINAVSAAFHVANSALRKWVQRFAQEGPQGLRDRPRSRRPPKLPCKLAQHRQRLVEQAPLEHGSLHAPWSWRELATVFARATGVHLGRASVRGVLKNISATPAPPAN
jgi:transposase